jgi:5-methylcytosine-specific restriction endonuclease McrA
MRREFPARVKVAAYERSGGFCEACSCRLQIGRIHYDHVLPDALGGEPTFENCAVLCHACHAVKTTGEDVPRISKMKRQRAAHLGARQSKTPMPFGKQSKFKRKLDGTIVKRGEG